jgi:hypothetical protein
VGNYTDRNPRRREIESSGWRPVRHTFNSRKPQTQRLYLFTVFEFLDGTGSENECPYDISTLYRLGTFLLCLDRRHHTLALDVAKKKEYICRHLTATRGLGESARRLFRRATGVGATKLIRNYPALAVRATADAGTAEEARDGCPSTVGVSLDSKT